jgi:DNA-binding NarL/FixJ family response regulator
MPILDGLEALPLIRSACPETKILLFSSYVEPSRVSAGMPSLPDAFIDKGQALETVLEAILELSLQEAPAVLSQESPPAGR